MANTRKTYPDKLLYRKSEHSVESEISAKNAMGPKKGGRSLPGDSQYKKHNTG